MHSNSFNNKSQHKNSSRPNALLLAAEQVEIGSSVVIFSYFYHKTMLSRTSREFETDSDLTVTMKHIIRNVQKAFSLDGVIKRLRIQLPKALTVVSTCTRK